MIYKTKILMPETPEDKTVVEICRLLKLGLITKDEARCLLANKNKPVAAK